MKIELKNVKYSAFASHETHCFEATIYIDGKRAGTVSNNGCGGADDIHPRELEERLNAYAKTLPPETYADMILWKNAEMLIGDLMNKWLERKENKRLCAKQVCFRIPGKAYAEGAWHALKCMYSPTVKARLVAKYGADVRILNEEISA